MTEKTRKKKAVVRKPVKALDPAPVVKPKKKKPPKKIQSNKLPGEVSTKGRKSSIEVVLPEDAHPSWIRKQAGVYYVTDLIRRCTVKDMHNSGLFPGIPLDTLRKWATRDRWNEQRKAFEARYQHAIERQRGADLARERAKEMKRSQLLLDKMEKKLLGKKQPEAKSYEGMVTAWVRLASHIEALRETQLDQAILLNPPQAQSDGEESGQEQTRQGPQLSAEEAREAARAILEVRRRRIREDLGIEDEEADKSLLE